VRLWTVRLAGVLAGILTVLSVGSVTAANATENLDISEGGTLRLEGRGYGHGVGMSQNGAKVGAQEGAGAAAILAHYYPGASLTDLPRAPIRVALTKGDAGRVWCESVPLVAVPCFRLAAEDGLRFRAGGREIPVPGDVAGASVAEVAVGSEPDGLSLWVFAGDHWHGLEGGAHFAGSVEIAGTDGALSLIWPDGKVGQYAGDLRAVWQSATTLARVNVVDMEDYLLGVVPAEMPAAWPAAAVQAQAVAARTYAHAARAAAGGRPFDICDTTACQVYGGVAAENAEATAKIISTQPSDVRRKMLTVNGSPINAMFSASNGGHSLAGGRDYLPARQDDWDPVLPWEREVAVSCLEDRHPGRGPLREVLLDRDGRGEDEGRVNRMRLRFADSTVEFTGANPQAADSAIRHAFDGCGAAGSLRSSWFGAEFIESSDSGIIRYWKGAGGDSSFLGSATSAEYPVAGGVAQDFAKGRVFWSPATKARSMIGAVLARFTELNSTASALGFPVADERPTRAGGAYSLLQGGKILWHPNAGAHPVWGGIADLYDRLGAENGGLAYPVESEQGTTIAGVVRQRFEFGAIYWDTFHGPRAVQGGIYERYLREGAENGVLGDPVSGEYDVSGGRRSDFVHGFLTWNAATGAVELTLR
jgi:hypothetical protein